MADVSDRLDILSATRSHSRGQLFLVGALALAVLFVSLAFLLNTAIYTENLATRSDGTATADVVEYQQEAEAHSRTSMQYINHHNNTTYTALDANYTASISNWSDAVVTHRAANGQIGDLSVTGITHGTRIEQDTDRNFTDKNGASQWTLAQNATVRNYTMEVERGSLLATDVDDLLGLTPLHVNFTETDGDTWTVYVYQSSNNLDNIKVAVKNESRGTVGTCKVTASRVVIGITNKSINGKDCPPLHFFDKLDENYDVQYNKGTEVTGVYSLTVDRRIADLDSTHYYSDEDGSSPYITPALYSTHLHIIYRGPSIYYDEEYQVAPGEPDE